MKISINDHRKIFTVQEEFNQLFPHLRLSFLRKPNKASEASSRKIINAGGQTIGQCRVVHTKGELTVSPSMTVADLQESFRDNFGLSVLVFWRSVNDWVETTENGILSLREQDAKQPAAVQ
jgi:hypothetical protein